MDKFCISDCHFAHIEIRVNGRRTEWNEGLGMVTFYKPQAVRRTRRLRVFTGEEIEKEIR